MRTTTERLVAFDLLRSVMLLLLVVFHAGVSFMTTSLDAETWQYQDASTNIVFDGTLAFIHALRHPTFFIISGFVTELMFRNYTRREVFTKRLKRIFVPFLVVLLLVGPVTCALLAYLNGIADPFSAENMFPSSPGYFMRISTSYVWFLYYLLLFSTVHVIISLLSGEPAVAKNNMSSTRFAVLLVVITGLFCSSLIGWKQNTVFGQYYLLPALGSLAGYFCFYLFGVAIARVPGSLEKIQQTAFLLLAIGMVSFIAHMAVSYYTLKAGRNPVEFDWLIMFSSSFSAIYLSLGGIGLALKYYKKPVALVTYISRSSYFLYLLHFPVILVILVVVAPYPMNPFLKFSLIFLPALAVTFLFNHFWLKAWKNNPPI
jgi:glucans biosynthesis protein C